MGTLLEVRARTPSAAGPITTRREALQVAAVGPRPDDRGRLAACQVPGIGETMLLEDRPARDLRANSRPTTSFGSATPPGLVALLRVPGLGPKKIKTLARRPQDREPRRPPRGGRSANKIAEPQGVRRQDAGEGPRRDYAFIESVGERILQSTARSGSPQPILAAVQSVIPTTIRAETCGSLRRCRAETIGDLDILFSSADPVPVLDQRSPGVARGSRLVLAHGPTKVSRSGSPKGSSATSGGWGTIEFPFALHYFTGSKAHNIAMRRRAIERGLKLNEYALEGDGPGRSDARTRPSSSPPSASPTSRPRCARTPANSSWPSAGPVPPNSSPAQRPQRDVPLPHRLERRRGDPGGDGRGGDGPRPDLPRDRRPLPIRRVCRRGLTDRQGQGQQWEAIDRPQRGVQATASGSTKGPSATSSPTARSTIPTTVLLAGFDYVVASVHSLVRPRAGRPDDGADRPGGEEPAT